MAVRLARKPADSRRTYGYGRLEALGALFNGGLLLLVAGWILVEAVHRFRQPPEVQTTMMLAVAVIGLAVNLVAMRLLKAGSGQSLNLRGAYLEVWADMLGSVAVIAGAGLIWATGWRWIDAAIAVAIGLWVLPRTLMLTRDAVHLLLEGVPRDLDLAAVRAAMQAEPGVGSVHDLHVWSLTSKQPLLTAHVAVSAGHDPDTLLRRLATLLHDRFDISHTTLQMETGPCTDTGCESPAAAHDHDHRRH
jgi:cobalt-zinc-cadmium efflux system protein